MLQLLTSHYIEDLASQSASADDSDGSYEQEAATKLTAFYTSAQGFQGLLANLFADKGLANYDKTDELQTTLKDFVNANKDALKAVSDIISNDPTLGPILGPSKLTAILQCT